MSGITSARFLRDTYDIIVTHEPAQQERPAIRTLRVGGRVLKSGIDDPLATGAYEWNNEVVKFFKEELKTVGSLCAAPTSYYNVKVDTALASVSLDQVDTVMPLLKEKLEKKVWDRLSRTYEDAKAIIADTHEHSCMRRIFLYDTIVKIFLHMRQCKLGVPNTTIPPGTTTLTAALASLGQAVCVEVDNSAFVVAFTALHPEALDINIDGKRYLFAKSQVEAMSMFGGNYDPVGLLKKDILDAVMFPAQGVEPGRSETVTHDFSDTASLPFRVARIMTNPPTRWSPEDASWMGTEGELMAKLGVSQSSLRGAGKTAGTGPVMECVNRLVTQFGLASTEENKDLAIQFAAIRLAKMTSNKRAVDLGGVPTLLDRA